MAYVSVAAAVVIFLFCFKVLNVVPSVRRMMAEMHDAYAVIHSKELTDDEKEADTRRAAINMAGSAVSIIARVTVCLLLPILAVWLVSQSGAYSVAEAMAAASDWTFIAVSSVVMIVVLVLFR